MIVTFLGAAHEVTGSCIYLEACGKRLLIDCGMEQGRDIFENRRLPVAAGEIDAVLLTHAHIDHSGMLPLLYKNGFRGTVYSTKATADLCSIMLRDSAHIQMTEAEWRNRKAKRAGQEPVEPVYDMDDAVGAIGLFLPCAYGESVAVSDGITVRFADVGHLLGSASIEVAAEESGVRKTVVFSGDIGNQNKPMVRNPTYLTHADYVVMESTYGDRLHGENPDYIGDLADIIRRTFRRGGNVVIPAFAVGRTQEMLYFIRTIKSRGMLDEFGDFEVYVDSPLAIEATEVFRKNEGECFDAEALELLRKGINPLSFEGLKMSVTSEESKAINFNPNPKVIISASGMCEAGRIRHHLKHNLWRPECTVVFVGYQSDGTIGRLLQDGAETVKLFGESIEVHAEIARLDGISGHADQKGLLEWLGAFIPKPETVFLVHGEDGIIGGFEQMLNETGYRASAPYSGSRFDLATGQYLEEALPVPIAVKQPDRRAETVYRRLQDAGQRLQSVIRRSKGLANKELARLADQINALCDKWE